MTTQDKKPARCRGRARSLILVSEEERWEKNRLWVTNYPTPGWGRAETLSILTKWVEWALGWGQRQPLNVGRGLTIPNDTNQYNLEPVRTWGRTLSPCPQGFLCSPLWWPVSWPKCLGRGFPSTSPPNSSPILSPTSESNSSGPPSLESITGPEFSYEASSSSSME